MSEGSRERGVAIVRSLASRFYLVRVSLLVHSHLFVLLLTATAGSEATAASRVKVCVNYKVGTVIDMTCECGPFPSPPPKMLVAHSYLLHFPDPWTTATFTKQRRLSTCDERKGRGNMGENDSCGFGFVAHVYERSERGRGEGLRCGWVADWEERSDDLMTTPCDLNHNPHPASWPHNPYPCVPQLLPLSLVVTPNLPQSTPFLPFTGYHRAMTSPSTLLLVSSHLLRLLPTH